MNISYLVILIFMIMMYKYLINCILDVYMNNEL